MNPFPVLMSFVVLAGILYLFMRQNRERTTNAPLRGEIQSGVRFATRLNHVSIRGTGGFGGTLGQWIRLTGPKRLVVGADAFMISLPQALRDLYLPDASHLSDTARHRPGWLNATGLSSPGS